MQDVSEDFRTMLAALRAAVANPADAARPGRLRQRLEGALGPQDSVRLRRLVHQVVAAAEENLPHDLRRITPLTTQSLHRLSDDLAAARGWSPDAARRTTQLWASALGFGDLASSSWPRGAEDRHAPAAHPSLPLSATLLPGAPPLQPTPQPAPLFTPLATPPAVRTPPAGPALAWPPVPKNLARHTTNVAGEPALGVCLAYAGMSLTLCVVLVVAMTVVLLLPIIVLGGTGGILAVLGAGGAKLLINRLGRGALIASTRGLEFVPYDTSLSKPRPEKSFGALWPQVSVAPAGVSQVRIGGRRVQVGPRNKAFVAALAARTGPGHGAAR